MSTLQTCYKAGCTKHTSQGGTEIAIVPKSPSLQMTTQVCILASARNCTAGGQRKGYL